MDDHRFDALTRTLSSRRSALTGVLGGVAALLGFAVPEEADAHNYLARCQQLRNPGSRRRCLRLARAHNRRHRYCRSITRAEACGRRNCGGILDVCGRGHNCGVGPSALCAVPGRSCHPNLYCAVECTNPGSGLGCPAGCFCSDVPEPGLFHYCITEDLATQCAGAPCPHSAYCGAGFKCEPVPCGPGGAEEHRCVPLCP